MGLFFEGFLQLAEEEIKCCVLPVCNICSNTPNCGLCDNYEGLIGWRKAQDHVTDKDCKLNVDISQLNGTNEALKEFWTLLTDNTVPEDWKEIFSGRLYARWYRERLSYRDNKRRQNRSTPVTL